MELPLQNVLFKLSRKYLERGLKATPKILPQYLFIALTFKSLSSFMRHGRTAGTHLTKCHVFHNFIFFVSYGILVLHKDYAKI